MTEPVRDYLVVELATGLAAAYRGKLLADGGADVIKVESPAGDPLRACRPAGTNPDGADGALFTFLAGAKRSVCVNVASAADLGLARALLGRADAVIVTPEAMAVDAPEFEPAALRSRYHGLTVLSITSFGLGASWYGRA